MISMKIGLGQVCLSHRWPLVSSGSCLCLRIHITLNDDYNAMTIVLQSGLRPFRWKEYTFLPDAPEVSCQSLCLFINQFAIQARNS